MTYSFTNADLSITIQQLIFYMQNSESQNSALLAVRTLAEQCNYGGRVTDERDKRILSALLEQFCKPEPVMNMGDKEQLCSTFDLPLGA
jgi:dynein heavy chain